MNRVTLYINPKQKRADSTFAIYISTVVCGQPVRFNTGVHSHHENIDLLRGIIRGTTKEVKDKNLIINNCKARINDIFVRYRLRFSELTPELLRREYENYTSNFLFYDYAITKLCDRKLDLSNGTFRRHKAGLGKIKIFSPELRLNDITEITVQELIRWCKTVRKNKASCVQSTIKLLSQ